MNVYIVYTVEEYEGITEILLVTTNHDQALVKYHESMTQYILETWQDGMMINRI